MWKKVVTVIAIILLLGGIGFLLFPTVSNQIGQQRANNVIEEYSETLDNIIKEDEPEVAEKLGITAKTHEEALELGEIDEEGYPISVGGVRTYSYPVTFEYDLDRLLEDSRAYNASIIHNQGTVDTINYEKAALDMSRYGLNNLYGYLSAPAIDLYLPVYLGANDSVMSYGAAHLSGTSLPLDEKDTNVAIAGHTGYIGRIFFDNIKRLNIGDTVSFTNYWETIDYEVPTAAADSAVSSLSAKRSRKNGKTWFQIKPFRYFFGINKCSTQAILSAAWSAAKVLL